MRTGQGRPAQTPWWGWGLLAIGLILTLPGAADRLAADGPRGLPAPEAGPVYSSPQAAEAAAKGSPVFDQQPVWQTYDVADVLSSDFADVPNDEERRRAFLNEVVAMAVRKSQRQFGLSLVDSQPVFRQITWDENQLRLEATPSEHAALAHLLKQRREHPGAVKQVVRIETRWMTDVAGELLKGVTWSESPDSSASSRRCAFLNDTQLQDLLKTIQSDPKSNLLSAPKVTTFSGQPAMIQVGSERQVLFPTNSGSEGDDRKPAVQVVTEGMTWELTPTVHTDGIISLRLALQQQAVTDVNMLQDGDARFQFPIVSASQVKTMLRLEPGRHVVLEFPDFRGKTVLGIVSATVEKPDRERKTSAIPQPNPIVPTYEPPANADDAIIVQLPVSRALDDTTPVRVRLSGKRSTIASDYLKRRASPPTTFGDVTKRLPDELRDHYHKLGYLFAAIDVNIEPDDESETGTGWKAIVYVNEGPRVLSETRKEVEPGNPFGGVTGEFDVELHPLLRHDHLGKAIHHHLQREGYFDARVTITRTKRPDSEPNAVPYRVRIETGRRFKVTCLQIAPGVSAMLDEGFPKDFPIQEGMAFDRQQVERAYPALRRWFAKHGHHNVDFTTHVRGGKTDGNVVIQFFAASISLDKLTRELVLNQRPADPRPVSQVESPWAPAEQASSPLLQNKERTWREIAQQRKASQGATNLNQTIQLEFHDTPLSDAIAEIQRRTNTNIVLDEVGLEELGIRRDMPVNLKLSGISGRSALKILAQSVGLAVAAGDEAVIITSPDRADPLIVMTYPVADLSHDPTKPRPSSTEAGKAAENNQENLADLIRSTIDPNSWDTSGGRGTMKFFAPNYLVIRQTQRNHEEIASLLSQLRRQRDLQIVFQAYERTVSNDDWASSEPLDGSESVRLLKAPSSNSGIKVTVLNSSRFSPVLITQGDVAPAANLKQGPIEVLPVVSADRRKIALLILPTSHPSRLEPLPITVPDGQTVLIDISATVPPGDPRLAEGSRAVLELTPKIIVPEEEEEVLRWPGSPPLLAPGSEVTR